MDKCKYFYSLSFQEIIGLDWERVRWVRLGEGRIWRGLNRGLGEGIGLGKDCKVFFILDTVYTSLGRNPHTKIKLFFTTNVEHKNEIFKYKC